MKRAVERIGIAFAVIVIFCVRALAMPETLVRVGRTVGIHLRGELTVAAIGDDAEIQGLKIGDRITAVNGSPVYSAEEVRMSLNSPKAINITVEREGKTLELSARPVQREEGLRLGIRVRDGISGLGTVTFYDPQTGRFGALGHGVSEPKTGRRIETVGGSISSCRVTDVAQGRSGAPGELHGAVSDRTEIGEIEKNTAAGIFGVMTSPVDAAKALPIERAEQVKPGPAQILSNVTDEEVRAFSVMLLKIDPDDGGGRNYLLQVCDDELLSVSGGIVQGMSGSPIIQDGHIIGAVTHVLVDDPTIGYGISIENMLAAAACCRT